MKFYLISDNVDTLTGMRIAGIMGVVAHTKQEVLDSLNKAANDKEIGIILITELLAEKVDMELRDIRLDRNKPIITIIPDRHGARRGSDYITNYIKESIGIKI